MNPDMGTKMNQEVDGTEIPKSNSCFANSNIQTNPASNILNHPTGNLSCVHCNFILYYQNFLAQQYYLLQLMYSHSQHCGCGCHNFNKCHNSNGIPIQKTANNQAAPETLQEVALSNQFKLPGNFSSENLNNQQQNYKNHFFNEDKRKTGDFSNENEFKVDRSLIENILMNRNEPSLSEENSPDGQSDFQINESPAFLEQNLQLKMRIV